MIDEVKKEPAISKRDDKKKKSFKSFNPKSYINVSPQLKEAVKKETAVVTFGRFNPITIGHEKLADKIISTASKMKGDPMIFLSHSSDSKKNPLSYEDKLKFAQKAFGKMVVRSNAKQIIQVSKELQNSYKNLVVVVGSDRVKEFETLLTKYNGKEYSFDSIQVVSAGERDPDAEGVSGMSASKMRALAIEGDFDKFKKGLPRKLQSSAEEVYDAVRDGLGLNEDFDIVNERQLSSTQRRKMSQTMKKNAKKIARARKRTMNKKASVDKLKSRARKAALKIVKDKLKKDASSGDLSVSQKNTLAKRLDRVPKAKIDRLAKKLLPDIRKREAERMKSKNEAFELFLEGRHELQTEASLADTKPKKRFHMMLNKDLTCKIDKRFKAFKHPATQKPEDIKAEEVIESVLELQNSVEEYISEAPFGSNTSFFKKMLPGVESWLDRNIRSKQYKAAVKQFIKFKEEGRKNPLVAAAKIWNVDIRTLQKYYDQMASDTFNESFEQFIEESKKAGAGDEGTNELVKTYKKDTPPKRITYNK